METIVVIPGFSEKPTDPQYRRLKRALAHKDTRVVIVPLTWARTVLSDWIGEVTSYLDSHKIIPTVVVGFSFGAIIALAVSAHLRAHRLVLCSVSPYFAEDIPYIPRRWKAIVGKRRVADFDRHATKDLVRRLRVMPIILLGEKENKQYPRMLKRARAIQRATGAPPVVMIQGAPHDIGFGAYRAAVVEAVWGRRDV